jgi:vacuolar-type H+-ATPase subunit F/Vma7
VSSKLQDEKWAVLSHLGLEAKSLTHEEARRLVHRLASEGRHGLCIVSDEAANRLSESVSSTKRQETLNKV